MKRILVFVVLGVFFASCASRRLANTTYYNMTLIKVEKPSSVNGKIYDGIGKYGIEFSSYEDESIDASFSIHPTHVYLVLENKTESTIKVVWDDAVFSGFDNESDGVYHSGVYVRDRTLSQVPSSILKGTSLSELVAPKKMRYILYGNNASDGKTIKLLIPIEIGGVKNEYIFTFESLHKTVRVVKLGGIGDGGVYYREIIR